MYACLSPIQTTWVTRRVGHFGTDLKAFLMRDVVWNIIVNKVKEGFNALWSTKVEQVSRKVNHKNGWDTVKKVARRPYYLWPLLQFTMKLDKKELLTWQEQLYYAIPPDWAAISGVRSVTENPGVSLSCCTASAPQHYQVRWQMRTSPCLRSCAKTLLKIIQRLLEVGLFLPQLENMRIMTGCFHAWIPHFGTSWLRRKNCSDREPWQPWHNRKRIHYTQLIQWIRNRSVDHSTLPAWLLEYLQSAEKEDERKWKIKNEESI